MPSSVLNSTVRLRTESTGSPRPTPAPTKSVEPTNDRSLTSAHRLRIERVAQPVTEEVHREHGQQDHEAREEDLIEATEFGSRAFRLRQHQTPGVVGGLHPEAKEGQRRFRDDRRR